MQGDSKYLEIINSLMFIKLVEDTLIVVIKSGFTIAFL